MTNLWTFQPGEQWAYTNLGYIVLGYLLERISGQTYEEFVHDNLFKPLGMNDSGMFSFVIVIPRRAFGYWPGSNGIENAVAASIQGSASRPLSLFVNRRFAPMERGTVPRQAIDTCISAQMTATL